MCRNLLLLIVLYLSAGLALRAQEQQTSFVYFSLDSDVLDQQAEHQLEALLHQVAGLDHWQLDIRAHTDATGTDAYNNALAEKRAAAVHHYLLDHNLPSEQIHIATFGENRPLESNETELGRSRNRRVELKLTTIALDQLQDLLSSLAGDPSQQFTLQGDQATAITGRQGTMLWIPADLFVFPDGSPASGLIDLEMQEAYTYADMVALGLSTHSGQEMLETGGMVFLSAHAEGQELQIRPGGELILSMPTATQKPGMQLFTGDTDANGRLTNWNPSGQPFATSRRAVLRLADPPPMPKIRTELSLFEFDESGKPIPPSQPQEPIYPKAPKRESVQFHPGFFQRLTLGKKKIQEREEAVYAEKVAQYETRVEKYPVQMANYKTEMGGYEEKVRAYEEAMVAWQAGLQEQWKQHQLARREKYKDALMAAEQKYRRTLEAYEAYKAKKIAAYEAEVEQGVMDQQSLNQYFFAVNRLGWINCDRFYNIEAAKKQPLLVQDNDEQEELIFVLFTDIRSALRTFRKGSNFYSTQSVPQGATAKVIGLKVENGRSMMAVKEITVGAEQAIALEYQPRRLAEIRQTLTALN